MIKGSSPGKMPVKAAWRQEGVSLVELMVASALGLLLILAAIGLLLASRQTYVTVDEQIAVRESGHYALTILARSLRQAGWSDASPGASGSIEKASARIQGLDARSLRMASENIENPVAAVSHGSDVLALRFGGAADGSIVNCAGFTVSKVDEAVQGWSIFFIGGERNTEPELRCKYRGKSSWRTEGIARGVESFQVLYGLDTDADGLPNQFLSAARISQLDTESDDEDGSAGTYWNKVTAVKIAMLVRSARNLRETGQPAPFHLFGESYSKLYGNSDRGTFIRDTDIPQNLRSRLRMSFAMTLPLRNHQAANEQ